MYKKKIKIIDINKKILIVLFIINNNSLFNKNYNFIIK